MKVKYSDIWNAKKPLETIGELKAPVKTSLQIAKLANKIAIEYQVIDQVRIGLLKKYGDKDDRGNVTVIGPNDAKGRPISANWEKFVLEFNELMNHETELVFDKIKLPENLEIEPNILALLEKFVEV